jgi:HEPN domain-containing protein
MTPSEARARESREWLAKADEDLASAHVLTWHERAFRRTHDLEELGDDCRAIDETLAVVLEQADVLSDYAWKLRYPGANYTPELEEAETMFGIARGIFHEIEARLHSDGV